MKIKDLMTKRVESCSPETDLGTAGSQMWHADCGILPVVEGANRKVLGTITDRDICMALVTSGKRPHERTVGEVMSPHAHTVTVDAEANDALDIMARNRVRRLPVVNADGSLQGIVSLNDLVQYADDAHSSERPRVSEPKFVHTLQAICAHPGVESRSGKKTELATAPR